MDKEKLVTIMITIFAMWISSEAYDAVTGVISKLYIPVL